MGTTLDGLCKSRALRAILCILLAAMAAIPMVAPSTAQSAHAYASDTVYLEIGDRTSYDSWHTSWMHADGIIAYCTQPRKWTPDTGTYAKRALSPTNEDRVISIQATLYYGWGGPGFDASLFPATWYDGSAMTAENYLALTHIIVADIYASDSASALANTSEAFRNYCYDHVLAYDARNDNVNGDNVNSTQYKLYTLQGNVPQEFRDSCYEIAGGANSAGNPTQVLVSYEPLGWIEVQKSSSNPSISEGNALYSLAGAVYRVYTDSDCTNLVDAMTTNSDGYAKSKALGTGTYYVKETSAPSGYALDVKAYAVSVAVGSTARVESAETPQNNPAELWIDKVDGETMSSTPLGAASLAGTEFTVRYYTGHYASAQEAEASGSPARTWVVATDAEGHAKLLESYRVSGDAFYYSSNGVPTIPLGTVVIQETKAPEGYLLDSTVHVRQVTGEGTVESVWTYQAPTQLEQVKRGDLKFTKTSETSQNRLANVPFKITSRATGESHIAVTDANGHFSTSSDYAAHSADTNDNDAALNADGTVDDAKLDSERGIWFGQYEDAEGNVRITETDDELGALPYDVYDIEELACAANEGLQLVHATATIARDGYTVDFGTIDDPEANIATRATDKADGDQNVAADDQVAVMDRVTYSNLIPNREYVLSAQLVDRETGKVVSSAEQSFAPEASSGYVNMELAADTIELAGRQLVVYETLSLDERVVASHVDADDADQTVTVVPPEIGTTAADGIDGDRMVVADPKARVVDTVSYTGLVPEKEYVVAGTLMVKSTDEEGTLGGEELTDAEGNPVTASAAYTPEESSGTVEVTFEFDASALPDGAELVAFETLYRNGVEIAAHADIADEGQTVMILHPTVGTTASDGADGDKDVMAGPDAVVVDVMEYEGAVPGKEYVVTGMLMVKSADEEGNAVGEELLDADGNPVTASATFVPEETSGTVEVTFEFDASLLAGQELVAFESLSRDGVEVAAHADLYDEGQTVTVKEEEQPLEVVFDKTGEVFDKTGNLLGQYGWVPALAAAAAIGLAVWGLRQRKPAKVSCNWVGGSESDWRSE